MADICMGTVDALAMEVTIVLVPAPIWRCWVLGARCFVLLHHLIGPSLQLFQCEDCAVLQMRNQIQRSHGMPLLYLSSAWRVGTG